MDHLGLGAYVITHPIFKETLLEIVEIGHQSYPLKPGTCLRRVHIRYCLRSSILRAWYMFLFDPFLSFLRIVHITFMYFLDPS